MTTQNKLAKVYVSLDCLLDTRLGALSLINSDFCYEVTTAKSYFMREEDSFKTKKMGQLSKGVFKEIIRTKKQEIVRNSLKTKMHGFIRELCTKLFFEAMSTPFHSGVEIDVNVYPYEFNESEARALIESLVICLGKEFSINLISKTHKQLDVAQVRENYRCVIMYEYHEWINLYDTEIKKKPLRDTGFYVPRLYFGQLPSGEELKTFAENNTDPFSFSQQILAPLVLIQYLPIALFCADSPANKAEYLKL